MKRIENFNAKSYMNETSNDDCLLITRDTVVSQAHQLVSDLHERMGEVSEASPFLTSLRSRGVHSMYQNFQNFLLRQEDMLMLVRSQHLPDLECKATILLKFSYSQDEKLFLCEGRLALERDVEEKIEPNMELYNRIMSLNGHLEGNRDNN